MLEAGRKRQAEKKEKMRKNKAQHFLEVTTKGFPSTKQTNEKTDKQIKTTTVTNGPLQVPVLPVPRGLLTGGMEYFMSGALVSHSSSK